MELLFDRPWTVETVSSEGEFLTWQTTGLRAGADRHEIVALLAAGIVPPPDGPTA